MRLSACITTRNRTQKLDACLRALWSSDYEICTEAARLYVGIKRYKYLYPDPLKLGVFLSFYFMHMTAFLLKRGSLNVWPDIVRRSHIKQLWQLSHLMGFA